MAPESRSEPESEAQHRTLRSLGLTLIGIVLSISVSVGFGMTGPWWLRLAIAVGTAIGLVAVIKLSTRQGSKGPMATLADWITGETESRNR